MNKLLLLLLISLSTTAYSGEFHVFQIGKTFTEKLKPEKLNELKNSRGKYISRKVKKHKIKEIKIKAGDTVNFHNKDTVVHNVFGTDFNFHQGKDSVNKKTFKEKGTRIIRCAIHPKMKLKVIVD